MQCAAPYGQRRHAVNGAKSALLHVEDDRDLNELQTLIVEFGVLQLYLHFSDTLSNAAMHNCFLRHTDTGHHCCKEMNEGTTVLWDLFDLLSMFEGSITP